MKGPALENPNHYYGGEYAKTYLEKTLLASYTINKSKFLVKMAGRFGARRILDLGSNIHGSVKAEGSLRFQLNQLGINYSGIDLSPHYFDRGFLKEQNVPEDQIYPEIKGIVGDILKTPVRSGSQEIVVCSDVLEHVSDPSLALREINRIISPEGVALVVLPFLYKLDLADFGHIDEKRKSSHLGKKTINEWVSLCEENGFMVDEPNSFPIGIASGLSYLAWVDGEFVPKRDKLSGPDSYSPHSLIHKEAKNIFSKYDEAIDVKIQADGATELLVEAFKNGDIHKVFRILKEIASEVILDAEDQKTVEKFFVAVSSVPYSPERVAILQKIFRNSRFPELLLGNSVLLALKKKK